MERVERVIAEGLESVVEQAAVPRPKRARTMALCRHVIGRASRLLTGRFLSRECCSRAHTDELVAVVLHLRGLCCPRHGALSSLLMLLPEQRRGVPSGLILISADLSA